MVWMKTGCSGVGLGEGDERAAGVDDIIDITECLSSMRRDVAVAAIAATSRLATLALMALFDGVFTDYDTSARPQAAPGAGSHMLRVQSLADASSSTGMQTGEQPKT